jgi:hypothetical protein
MATTPRKRVPPAKFTPPTKTEPNMQDINDWQDAQPVSSLVDIEDDIEDGYIVPDESEGSKVVEKPPNIPSKTTEKARSFVERIKTAPRKVGSASKTRAPRVGVDKLIGTVWAMFAQVAQPINLPVARVLTIQAPVAGLVLEGVVKDTIVDRLLQPLARAQQGGEVAFAIIGPPLFVGLLSNKPEMAPVLVPLLKQSLRSWIDVAGPQLEKVKKQEEKFENEYGAAIDEMIEFFLAPVTDNATGEYKNDTTN